VPDNTALRFYLDDVRALALQLASMKNKSRSLHFLAMLLGLAIVSPLLAQTPQSPYPINGPTTIKLPGYYRLTRNIISTATTGNIITIQSHNVTIDFNTFFIIGPQNTGNTVVGINANEFGNLTIKNGSIAFCKDGIVLTGNDNSATTRNINHIIDNMRITNCYEYGVYFPAASPGTVVSNCQISQIGGSTAGASFGIGLYALGTGILFKDNIISKVTGPSGSPTSSFGIASESIVVRTTISDTQVGLDSGSKYQNVLTTNVVTPFMGGTDAGGNN
jgi:hypothetical protein